MAYTALALVICVAVSHADGPEAGANQTAGTVAPIFLGRDDTWADWAGGTDFYLVYLGKDDQLKARIWAEILARGESKADPCLGNPDTFPTKVTVSDPAVVLEDAAVRRLVELAVELHQRACPHKGDVWSLEITSDTFATKFRDHKPDYDPFLVFANGHYWSQKVVIEDILNMAKNDADRAAREAENRKVEQDALAEGLKAQKAEAERTKAFNETAERRRNDFLGRTGYSKPQPDAQNLFINPFAYTGTVVLYYAIFQQMQTPDIGLFSVGTNIESAEVVPVVVTGLPTRRLTSRANVVIAGRVHDNIKALVDGKEILVPALEFVDIYECEKPDCTDFFGLQSP